MADSLMICFNYYNLLGINSYQELLFFLQISLNYDENVAETLFISLKMVREV